MNITTTLLEYNPEPARSGRTVSAVQQTSADRDPLQERAAPAPVRRL